MMFFCFDKDHISVVWNFHSNRFDIIYTIFFQ